MFNNLNGKISKYIKRLSHKGSSFIKKQKWYDIVLFLFIMVIILVISFTKIFYPFNYYFGYNRELVELYIHTPPIYVTVLICLLISLIFILWIILSPSKIRFIIPFYGLILRFIGSLSQNTFYTSDSIFHLGIILKLNDPLVIPLNKIIHYPFLLFHRFFMIISKPFSAYNFLLYCFPTLVFLMYVPLGDKLIQQYKEWKLKVLVGFLYYSFPFVLAQKYNITPYSFLIGEISLIFYLFPLDSRKKKIIGLIISIIASLTHIHGIFALLVYGLLIISEKKNRHYKKRTKINFIIFSSLIFFYLIIVFFKYQIINLIKDHIKNNFGIMLQFIIQSITRDGGYLSYLFIPKIAEGGIYAIWYIIQLIIFFSFLYIGTYYSLKFGCYKDDKSENNFETDKQRSLVRIYSIIIAEYSTWILIGLFYDYFSQLFRVLFFVMQIGFFVIIYALRNWIIKIHKSIIYVFIFILMFTSPLLIYNQYTPYSDSELELVSWINDYNNSTEYPVVILTHRHLYKLIWALGDNDLRVYDWPKTFWSLNIQDYALFHLNEMSNETITEYSLLIVFSSRIIAYELQFNSINITTKMDELRYYYDWTFYSFQDNYIYEFLIS